MKTFQGQFYAVVLDFKSVTCNSQEAANNFFYLLNAKIKNNDLV